MDISAARIEKTKNPVTLATQGPFIYMPCTRSGTVTTETRVRLETTDPFLTPCCGVALIFSVGRSTATRNDR